MSSPDGSGASTGSPSVVSSTDVDARQGGRGEHDLRDELPAGPAGRRVDGAGEVDRRGAALDAGRGQPEARRQRGGQPGGPLPAGGPGGQLGQQLVEHLLEGAPAGSRPRGTSASSGPTR